MSNHPAAAKSLNDTWLTIKLLAQAESSFTESAIRSYVFNAASRQTSKGSIPGNGLGPYIRRVGSKVLINHGGFHSWIDRGADRVGPVANHSNQAQSVPQENGRTSSTFVLKSDGAESRSAPAKAESFNPETQKTRSKSCSKEHGGRRI